MSEVKLRLQKVRKSYGSFLAVCDVELTVMKKELKALIGPNGAGKTTLLNLISGYLSPDSGEVVLDGKSVTGLGPHVMCKMGVARSFQVTRVFNRFSLLENLQVIFMAQNKKEYNLFSSAKDMYKDSAAHLLDQVGLSDAAYKQAGLLAPGKRKLLELAMTLASEPTLLLLDEPVAGMTPKEKASVMEMLNGIVGKYGISILFTEHDMDVVFSIAQSIAVMHQGSILADDEPGAIRNNSTVQTIYLG